MVSYLSSLSLVALAANNGYNLIMNLLPLPSPKVDPKSGIRLISGLRGPALDATDGKIYERWEEFKSKHEEMASVTTVKGTIPNTFASALGNSYFKKSQKTIAIDPVLRRYDVDATMFFCKHEYAHIKNNDNIIKDSVLLCINVAALFFCGNSVQLSVGASNFLFGKIYGVERESKADDWAIEHSTKEELEGAMRFFVAAFLAKAEIKKTSKTKNIFIEFERLIGGHPENQHRIAKVAKALQNKYKVHDFSKIIFDRRVDYIRNYYIFRTNKNVEEPDYFSERDKFLVQNTCDANPEHDPLRIMLSIELIHHLDSTRFGFDNLPEGGRNYPSHQIV